MIWFEWTAAVITAICIWLQARENIWNWPAAIVSVVMYAIVYIKSGLYSDAGLQAYFLVTSIYGWYEWLHGGANRTQLRISRVTTKTWLWCAGLGVTFWFVDATLTSQLKGVAFPYVDAATTTISLIAQWMVARKLLESWILWIVVNIVYVPMLIAKSLYPTAILYAVLLVLAIIAYVNWRSTWLRESGSVPAPAAA